MDRAARNAGLCRLHQRLLDAGRDHRSVQWENETVIVVLATEPVDGSCLVIVAVQATTDRDLAALDRIIDTFTVVSDV